MVFAVYNALTGYIGDFRAYLLETGQIGVHFYQEKWHVMFLSLASSVIRITDDPVDGYWLSVKIFEKISRYG